MFKKGLFLILFGFLISIYCTNAATFQFNGTVKDQNGAPLNGAYVNISIRNMAGWSLVGDNSTTTNASGWFNMSIGCNGNCDSSNLWIYEPSMTYYNGTYVAYKSKTIPSFPSDMIQMLAGTTFYLTSAGTMNITAINSSGGRTAFKYQIKDTKLGYPIASNFENDVIEVVTYVPSDRNYSIMIYPNMSMPVSFSWDNFSSTGSYNTSTVNGVIYNHTTKTLNKQFNTTMSMIRVTGYINYSGLSPTLSSWDTFTIIPYLVEPGNMIHSEYGDMPYNLSAISGFVTTDFFNVTDGFYNISLPATAETSQILLFAAARNNSKFYGGFRNISLSYNSYPTGGSQLATRINFTNMQGMLGPELNISMDKLSGGPSSSINISVAKQTFSLLNASNVTLGNISGHVEIKVDYSQFGAIEFTWMTDIAQSTPVANFSLPLLNSTGIKEMNIFVSGSAGGNDQYSPKRTSFTSSQMKSDSNITINTFNPGGIDAQIDSGSVSIALYISNSTCDIPNPSTSCLLGGSSQTMTDFNPMQAVMGGGKISFRMGTGNIFVHYVNVDLMASGPPDALFDNSTSSLGNSSSFASALRFGSQGPTMYDYVLISIPYSETAGSGLKDSEPVNISIPVFYDDNWNVIWNSSLSNGTSPNAFAGNYTHYSTYQGDWAYLMNDSVCTTTTISNNTQINSSNPCYIDTSNNRIWLRLPHFSGTSPNVKGTTATSTSSSSSSGGGGGGTSSNNIGTLPSLGIQISFYATDYVYFTLNNLQHTIRVTAVGSDYAKLKITSDPIYSTLYVGDTRDYDVTGDGKYDLTLTLDKIVSNKVYLTIKKYSETKTPTDNTITSSAIEEPQETSDKLTASEGATNKNVFDKINTRYMLIFLIVIGVISLILLISQIIKHKRKKHHYY